MEFFLLMVGAVFIGWLFWKGNKRPPVETKYTEEENAEFRAAIQRILSKDKSK